MSSISLYFYIIISRRKIMIKIRLEKSFGLLSLLRTIVDPQGDVPNSRVR